MMKLGEKMYDRILRNACGSYFVTDWAITDAQGDEVQTMQPGGFIAVENNYSYLVLHINKDMTLTECEKED
jgi:hypothetical protein